MKLRDLYQLKNWRNRTPPDYLHPKFKVFIEKFKKGEFKTIPQATSPGTDEDHDMQMLPDHEDQDDVTGEQRLQNSIQKESPTG